MANPLYSICITQLNDGGTIRQSLESIFDQIDERFEVVVVDAGSKDSSIALLRQYADEGKIKLIHGKGSRGKCRQAAFQRSVGNYVIANMDTDDVFNGALPNLTAIYSKRCEGFVLRVRSSHHEKGSVTIATRGIIDQLGGWRDLNYFEDDDLWLRAVEINKFRWISYPLYKSIYVHTERRSATKRMRHAFLSSREKNRMGVFPWRLTRGLPLHFVAWVSALFLEKYKVGSSNLDSKIMAPENHISLNPEDLEMIA